MQHLLKLILHDTEEHYTPNTLEPSAGAASTCTSKHTQSQYHPSHMWPLGSIIVKQSRRCYERYHLIYCATKSRFQLVSIIVYEKNHYYRSKNEYQQQIKACFYISEKVHYRALPEQAVKQDKVKSREEAEQCGHVF
jgi:hypothetical protein